MPNYNRVILAGNLTRDPELRYTANNAAICSMGMAINRKWRDANGENKEEVVFVDLDAFGKTAEIIAQRCHRGEPVLVEGRLKLDQWKSKDGQNRSKLKVVVERFQFLPSAGNQSAAQPTTQRTPAPAPTDSPDPADDDNIPF